MDCWDIDIFQKKKEFGNNEDTYNYISERYDNIKNIINLFNEKNIPIINADYCADSPGHNYKSNIDKRFQEFDFTYSSPSKYDVRNFKDKTVFFAGGSLDQCLFQTRSLSYKNINCKNKYILKDCIYQGDWYDIKEFKKKFIINNILDYEKLFYKKYNIQILNNNEIKEMLY